MVRQAARGDADARSVFARTYLPVVRAYLGARWRETPDLAHLDDAVQDVFLDCFREDGALGRLDPTRRVNFRTFLYGVVRNVALRYEERNHRRREVQPASAFDPADLPALEPRLSRIFDRAWAVAVIQRAGRRQQERACGSEAARRRVELLRRRFGDGMPIRDIAREWGADPAVLHREYAKARQEFKAALREEVAAHHPGTAGDVERELAALLTLLRGP